MLSVIIFLMAQVLPGDVGRRILGPFADQRAVDTLNHELGTDRSLIAQYLDWIGGVLTGDLGESQSLRVPVSDILWPALQNSAKLALLAFVIVVPLAILGGVTAARHEGRAAIASSRSAGCRAPRSRSSSGRSAADRLLARARPVPLDGAVPRRRRPLTQLKYLFLPAMCLVFVLFGYISRMARAGTIESLDADYTRTAYIKGLPERTVIRRHVLRNSLLPTIAVVATQLGYMFGGLVVVEFIFNYNGLGQVLFRAAQAKDFPLLQSSVLLIGVVFLVVTLIADILYSVLNPRVRLGSAE